MFSTAKQCFKVLSKRLKGFFSGRWRLNSIYARFSMIQNLMLICQKKKNAAKQSNFSIVYIQTILPPQFQTYFVSNSRIFQLFLNTLQLHIVLVSSITRNKVQSIIFKLLIIFICLGKYVKSFSRTTSHSVFNARGEASIDLLFWLCFFRHWWYNVILSTFDI